MKRTVFLFAVAFWVICGLAGAWRLHDMHFRTIARGPLSLIEALNEDPVSIPSLN